MITKERIEYIDLAKGICIILVVFMHIVPEIGAGNPYLINLRMPLYFCLSGMFFKSYGNFSNFIVKKCDRLLIPFVAWYVLSYGVYYTRVLFLGHPERVFKFTDLFYEPDFYNGSIWFLLSLFWVNLLYFIIHNSLKKEYYRIIAIFCLASLGWLWSFSEIGNFLYLGTSLTSLPFFYMGLQLVNCGIISNKKEFKRDSIIILSCIALAIICFFIPEEPARLVFYTNTLTGGNPFLLYLSAIVLVLFTLTLCKYIKKLPFISYVGRFSIIVLITHRLLSNILTRSLAHFTGLDTDNVTFHFCLFTITMIAMLAIIPFCRRYLPYICAQKSLLGNYLTEKLKLIKPA